jgi:peptidyl-prolyl cis-trans isomerase SurA
MTMWTRFSRHAITALLCAAMIVGSAMPSQAQSARATVNGVPITDAQVTARVRLLTLEGSNASNSAALDQLIDEQVKIQEASRLGVAVSGSQIDNAYLQIARNINLSQERLDQVLAQAGANPATLRARLEASIAWNEVVQSAVQPQVQISELELDQQAAAQVSGATSFDYILKEVIFVAPGGQGASARTGQANSYRQRFAGCDGAVDLSLTFTDAAVIDIGRRHATQLPEAIASELAGLNVGGITRPRVTEQGVSMYAVCEKTQANDLTFIKEDLRAEAGQGALEQEADAYLARLREQARIVRN